MTFQRVAKIIADYRDMEAEGLKLETTFNELELDSLDVVELVMALEEEFSVAIEMSAGIQTIADVVNLIEKA